MATIDATVGGTSSNSYVTLVEADAYWDANYHNSAWEALSDPDKQTLCIMATRLLDDWCDWVGQRATEDQALRWPRYSAEDRDGYAIDSDVIPGFLKNATSELALYLLTYDPSTEPGTKGFSRIKVDVIELEIDKLDRDGITAVPDAVIAMIEHYCALRKRGTPSVVNLIRA